MARIAGVEANEANLLTRVAYGMVRKKVGKVVMPIKVHALHPKLFRSCPSAVVVPDASLQAQLDHQFFVRYAVPEILVRSNPLLQKAVLSHHPQRLNASKV